MRSLTFMLTTAMAPGYPPERTALILDAWLEGYVVANVQWLQDHPQTPSILDPAAGIRYREQPKGTEIWYDRGELAVTREGDCKIIATAYVAEERMRGREHVRILIRWAFDESGDAVFHILTIDDATGVETDPCRLLGMN